MKNKPEPIGVDELKDAILEMMVDKFGHRPLDVRTLDMALNLVGFEFKQAVVFTNGKPPLRNA